MTNIYNSYTKDSYNLPWKRTIPMRRGQSSQKKEKHTVLQCMNAFGLIQKRMQAKAMRKSHFSPVRVARVAEPQAVGHKGCKAGTAPTRVVCQYWHKITLDTMYNQVSHTTDNETTLCCSYSPWYIKWKKAELC